MAKYGINKVILVGNLGRDPELRHLDQGIAVANFTLATSESFRNREGATKDRTEWHNIVMWRGLAETAAKYLRKGSTVYLEGRIVNRSWETPEGEKRYKTEIEADKMVMLDSKGSQEFPQSGGMGTNQQSSTVQNFQQTAQPEHKAAANNSDEYDDLPF